MCIMLLEPLKAKHAKESQLDKWVHGSGAAGVRDVHYTTLRSSMISMILNQVSWCSLSVLLQTRPCDIFLHVISGS